MAPMKRKQIYIEPWQEENLKRLARHRGVKEAEIIRQALAREMTGEEIRPIVYDSEAWEEARAFIESLIKQGPVRGGRTWKRQDVYDDREGRYGR